MQGTQTHSTGEKNKVQVSARVASSRNSKYRLCKQCSSPVCSSVVQKRALCLAFLFRLCFEVFRFPLDFEQPLVREDHGPCRGGFLLHPFGLLSLHSGVFQPLLGAALFLGHPFGLCCLFPAFRAGFPPLFRGASLFFQGIPPYFRATSRPRAITRP